MNLKVSIALLGVALALGGVTVYLVQTSAKPADFDQTEKTLFRFTVSRVDRVVVRKGLDVVYELQNRNGEWSFIQPPFGAADSAKVVRALSELRLSATAESELGTTGQVALEKYGLMKPRIEVAIQSPGESTTFAVGDATPTKDGVYLHLLDLKRIVKTQKTVLAEFDVPADHFKPSADAAVGPK
ncbi:MAG: DUF4340 domain-containing protein [Planctomycetes bacterium]|nr:DUF4340 domain-containing protein [Planctomycetota bacterium]